LTDARGEPPPMREVTPETASLYLRETGRVAPGAAVNARALGWGVSNVVIRVEVVGEPPFVLKQARERLRTQAHWVSRLDRIWTEHAALLYLAPLLAPGTVPEVLFADRDNYLFAMSAAPDDAVVWKERLLEGVAEREVARAAGDLLGSIHFQTFDHPALADGPLADTVVFDQLRLDPFYRTIARVHPEVVAPVEALLAPPSDLPGRCFVHADFSPKNILVHAGGLTLVDFETAHAGDPAYDLGFVLCHLLLKSAHATSAAAPAPDGSLIDAFLEAYRQRINTLPFDRNALDRRAAAHAAACALARVDGKSPVDYLGPQHQEAVRRFARTALLDRLATSADLVPLLAREMRSGRLGPVAQCPPDGIN
jgi:5-methylthioribose kinase